MSYANDTSVSVGRSKGEIEDLVQRAGGRRFVTMVDDDKAAVMFELGDRRIMFELPLPPKSRFATRTVRGREVECEAERQQRDWEQACRSLWRALHLTIKAKLVSVESGVETFEEAFLAQVVIPHEGKAKRFAEFAVKAIEKAYSGGKLPPLLGAGS